MDEMSWEPVFRLFDVRLIDGTNDGGDLMMRVVNGERQFRQMTEQEKAEIISSRAW
jgi:hypothetical protein